MCVFVVSVVPGPRRRWAKREDFGGHRWRIRGEAVGQELMRRLTAARVRRGIPDEEAAGREERRDRGEGHRWTSGDWVVRDGGGGISLD